MHLALISCEIFERELQYVLARSSSHVDLRLLPKALHDMGCAAMRQQLADALATLDESRYDAVVLVYGLCNLGTVGLRTRQVPLVIPRAHDCITVFLGDRQRYIAEFEANPGTYYLTCGWLELTQDEGEMPQTAIQHQTGMDLSYAELVAKYGEENAAYLYETLHSDSTRYGRYAFIETGAEPGPQSISGARQRADRKGWKLDHLQGDLGLLQRLVDGQWDPAEVLVLRPGFAIAYAGDHDHVVCAGPDTGGTIR